MNFKSVDIFNRISSLYDTINTCLSLGLDQSWRKALCRSITPSKKKLLDCATGTAEQLRLVLKYCTQIEIGVGIDPSYPMLSKGYDKLKNYNSRYELHVAAAEQIPYPDHSFDVVTISFGIRNVQDLNKSLEEMYRVLCPGGQLLILEFAEPENRFFRFFHTLYLEWVVRKVGYWLSKDRDAYSYLSSTIQIFPKGHAFCEILRRKGFCRVKYKPLSLGIVNLYIGEKD
jgi:demethylmenaquinone methyltransferase/2-methoxy-6-polyprenyl-1,4-benzoquinol methylase